MYNHIKSVVIGDGGVGKTSLLIRVATGSFPVEYAPTIFDNHTLHLSIDNTLFEIGIWDTAGGEDYPRLRPLSYPHTDCFVLCFSMSNKKSLENCYKYWYPEIQLFCPKCPVILVGTKSDNYSDLTFERSNLVEYDEAIKVADKIQAALYIETSALTGKNTTQLFEQVAIIGFNYSKIKKNDYHIPYQFNVEASRYIINAPSDKSKENECSSNGSSSSNDYNYENMDSYCHHHSKNCNIN